MLPAWYMLQALAGLTHMALWMEVNLEATGAAGGAAAAAESGQEAGSTAPAAGSVGAWEAWNQVGLSHACVDVRLRWHVWTCIRAGVP